MTDRSEKLSVTIFRTPHGKPYYDRINGLGEDAQESPLHDALDFPGEHGVRELENDLKAIHPGIEVSLGFRELNLIADLRSTAHVVTRDKFIDHWQHQLQHAANRGFDQISDPYRRIAHVELTGKDAVHWWSGWFHYPILIEESRRQMQDSGVRLRMLFEQGDITARDVIEEAYLEQVLRERLTIFERRREWWRIIRWGSTTALGLVLAAWSLVQIVERLAGG